MWKVRHEEGNRRFSRLNADAPNNYPNTYVFTGNFANVVKTNQPTGCHQYLNSKISSTESFHINKMSISQSLKTNIDSVTIPCKRWFQILLVYLIYNCLIWLTNLSTTNLSSNIVNTTVTSEFHSFGPYCLTLRSLPCLTAIIPPNTSKTQYWQHACSKRLTVVLVGAPQ
jgi:hypothetical protein